MDYYQRTRDEFIHNEMYPVDYRKDYFPKKSVGEDTLTLTKKPPCAPKFVEKIQGNAVEEGARVFFEAIVDAQPQPIFTWYFDDEEIVPGAKGWEECEIHHSRKMSTLILRYTLEHHMGKFTLVAQNKFGHSICNCDLIVRKKQYPPVFWKRLYKYEGLSGARWVAEVEVGGWPLPQVSWFKDGEPLVSKVHTENWNGNPNRYVPERRVEIKQIDHIRYAVIFGRISENDSGTYTCRAVNALGEAECESEFIIEPGEGGNEDLYLPELWLTGNRLNWAMEDSRMKPFVGVKEPELTPEDIADMAKRVASTPLPRAIEYLASLPPTETKPLDSYGFVPMNYSPESGLSGIKPKTGSKGGKPAKPSKFVPGQFTHRGYNIDNIRILPLWINPGDSRYDGFDINSLQYRPVIPDYPLSNSKPVPEVDGPHGPPKWESDETIKALIEMLKTVGLRNFEIAEPEKEKKTKMPERTAPRMPVMNQQPMQKTEQPKKLKPIHQLPHQEEQPQKQQQHPPVLPPKTKIMNSPSRNVFSPSLEEQQQQQLFQQQQQLFQQQQLVKQQQTIQQAASSFSSSSTTATSTTSSATTAEFVSVKEKAKFLAEQSEKDEMMQSANSQILKKGAVRILPPSPQTVRKNVVAESASPVQQSMATMSSQQQIQQQQQQSMMSSYSSKMESSSSMHQSFSVQQSKEEMHESTSSMVCYTNFQEEEKAQKFIIANNEGGAVSGASAGGVVAGGIGSLSRMHTSSSSANSTLEQRHQRKWSSELYGEREEPPQRIPVLEDKFSADHFGELYDRNEIEADDVEQVDDASSILTAGTSVSQRPPQVEEPDQAMAKAETKRVTFMELQEERENIINNNSHDGNNNELPFHQTSNLNELRLQESSQQPHGAQADQREQEALSDIHMEKSDEKHVNHFPSAVSGVNSRAAIMSPMTFRKLRQPSQSPVPEPEARTRSYRTPPNEPFQPPFYRSPRDNPNLTLNNVSYRLPNKMKPGSSSSKNSPSPSGKPMSVLNKRDSEAYDGDTEF